VNATDSEASLKRRPFLGQVLKTGLAFCITGAFLYWIIRYQIREPEQIWAHMTTARLLPLLSILPVAFLSHLLRAWRWRRFIGQPVSVFYSFSSVMIGYAVNDILPRVGELARVVNMNRITRVPLAQLLTTLVAERILDVIALVALLGISILIDGPRIAERFPDLARAGPIALILSLAGLFALVAIAFTSEFLVRIFGSVTHRIHSGLGGRVENLIRQGASGLTFLKRPSQALPILVETTGIWVLYFAAFLLGLASFGLLEDIGAIGGLVAFAVSTTGVLVPAVGAIGPYHEFGRVALTDLYQVDPNLALACITALHAMLFYVVGGLGGVLTWGVQIWVLRRGKPDHSISVS
jgi:uncharacterized protein (TIRG00374 family)